MNDSKILTIGFDPATPDCDISVLIVARQGDSLNTEIVNTICGTEAEELYNKLVGTGIKNLSPDEVFEIWKKEYLDEQDPVMGYKPLKRVPNAIIIKLHSGIEWFVQVSDEKLRILWRG